ncbi:MAG: N-acetylglucosamine kinase [Lunatimonas sp.]|uniref:N-acetylglucosamine kinase n=1 Tax=Lunatimonas sp. TaxID=2060141 RepID=UPI00263B6D0F|nr:N-acetylglucosamine kinase [Lunatimonas sp.]MCC5938353.1 N-acetylglucosamine kinase [Lunatimonas sp.]
MILIADSGSSKTDWRVIRKDGKIEQFRTVGFNPYYQQADDMLRDLQTEHIQSLKGSIEEVYFYGAGCTGEKNKQTVARLIKSVLGDDTWVSVDHDLTASAKATCGHKSGIACILGTGSNSGDYDGENIVANRPSPGYLLGDEGGGSYIGRHFLQDFIYDDMPKEIREMVLEEYQLTNLEIQENVYQKPFPNRYMASFCRFIHDHKNHPYCFQLFYNGFSDFFKRHVMRYANYQNKPVSFVGSIAFHNGEILRKVGADLGIHIDIILEAPIAGLTLYHQNKI